MGRALFIAFFLSLPLLGAEPILIVNSLTTSSTLPSRFRVAKPLLLMEGQPFISNDGLDELRASASSQFSIEELRAIKIELASDHVMIVDLREESHGYINNYAVSWYVPKNWPNAGLTLNEVLRNERENLAKVKKEQQLNLHKILEKGTGTDFVTMLKLPTNIHFVCSEEELCHNMNLGYFRIAVTDHVQPSNQMVDRFIALTKTMSDHTHLHFHCSSGAGRATTFMALYDMMHNAQNVSFEEIIARQYLLGGIDLLQAPEPTRWKYPYNLRRQTFLKNFYLYARENHDDFTTTFSEWSDRNLQKSYEIEI